MDKTMIDTEVARTFDRRSALFLTGGVVLTSVLVLRMLQMQVFNYKEYSRKSENNSFRITPRTPFNCESFSNFLLRK